MKAKKIIGIFFLIVLALASNGQTTAEQIGNINAALSSGKTTISKVLSDPSMLQLHSLTPFREMIRQNAKAENIKIVTANEPGTLITVNGVVLDKSAQPIAYTLVYVYQTSSEGWYSDTAPHILMNEGDRAHARLFGYFKTDSHGEFEFSTVKPKGYPNSSLPAHIHIEVSLAGDRSFISELLFDDDPRLVGDIRKRAEEEKFFIGKNKGTKEEPLYSYTVRTND